MCSFPPQEKGQKIGLLRHVRGTEVVRREKRRKGGGGEAALTGMPLGAVIKHRPRQPLGSLSEPGTIPRSQSLHPRATDFLYAFLVLQISETSPVQ